LPLESPTFFVDRSLGGKIVPLALELHGWNIKRHDKIFHQDADDPTWIYGAGKQGWIILTGDNRLRYNPLEKDALKNCGTLAFILADKRDLKGREMADVFIKAEKAIMRAIKTQPAPGVFRVYSDGHIAKCYL
jgi:hypothetical protein